MQSITNLYSSAYLTAIGMDTRRHDNDPFHEMDGERPIPKSLIALIKGRFIPVAARIRKISLKAKETANLRDPAPHHPSP